MFNSLVAKIHIAKKDLGLDDDTYRDILFQVTGKKSCSKCTNKQLFDVLNYFNKKGWPFSQERAYRSVSSPQLRKIYALWGELQSLGVIRNKDKSAIDQFVQRQIGIPSVDKLYDDDANKIIEVLKQWIRRVTHV